MFENLSLLTLQHYWWIIVSLLGSALVFLMFVQGGQTLIYTLGKNDKERTMLVNSLGRKWEFTFTTLVTFGGAFFASFPLFYATSFGGAYWVWMIILLAFVIQAVSYEFRSKAGNFLGAKVYEGFLFINGLFGTVLIGTAVATFFTGSQFSLNDLNQVNWEGPARGLEAALNIRNIALGFSVFFLARILAILYFMNNIDNDAIFIRSRKHLWINTIPFLIAFLFFLTMLLVKDGFAVDPDSKMVSMEKYKYLHNLLEMPVILVMLLIGVAGVLFGIIRALIKKTTIGIWFTGPGTILTVLALFLIAGFNNTAFYPSTFDLQSSLTIENASSSKFTLTVMSYVSLLVPVVVAYIWYAWRSMNRKQITQEELSKEDHVY
ncbi:MAG: cytochrome d ubiquinol oxidase subunit II [Bacteroidales bacterium]|jgi:cytochrome d ubiquinol oxidase subunit II|nr:cytochrome d ubiquinol oxidase subunit II [Bacteroidales bacterium]MDD2571212.1 cytochrome d ubiquinol oxidase subunit II [Bacteroidales bacterium]MDD2812095.1 cytochrome d ubiquinol oxidase subunit II [Bacteroidales bacterium]MDD3384396.1 cytochrome d ubiquinol oxidase subunit II [Bacteroidales bacterium]MDD3811127.1 cytochrome d ubiquinol oxidase subunit II [Bacteroidales bacterium]